jgi:flagellar motor component MotA
MFWIAFLAVALSWMMIKLGILSATASVLMFVVKLLLLVILGGLIAAVWSKFRGKAAK